MHYIKTSFLPLFLVIVLGLAVQPAYGQLKLSDFLPKQHKDTVKPDTARKVPPPPISKYERIINKNFHTQRGVFTVHQYRDSIYFEIPDSLLGRDIMVIGRLSKGPAGYNAYPGEELSESTIRFERGADSSIKIRYIQIANIADSADAIYKAVTSSSLDPVMVSLPVKAYSKDSSSCVIDATKLLQEKSFVNEIDEKSSLGKGLNLTTVKDLHVEYIHTYPINVEISITRNMNSKRGGYPGEPVTVETNTSFILLPKAPMQQRVFDSRVGYFADYVNSFGDDQQKMERRQFILRWKLEPKDEDIEKWKRGELVEPRQPITIYIDPATPKQWRPFLIQGINDWQEAFEQAGFKNAIIGKEWPANDTTMHMDDARYSWLNYFPSEVANAYGPQVHDPRSGEIIQTHIGWYHNVMTILHDWYMVQAAAVDPAARKAKFDDELMGQLIRFVSSHEVGHTLGLRHNFGSSSRTPVDSLRKISYLKAHGHTASIMDYARFNYVAQPEDHIPQQLLFPHIGEYDKWAIEWGYKSTRAQTVDADKRITQSWIVKRTTENPRLWFGDGETQKFDPRCQTEDLGDNAIKAGTYGIKNLQRILPHLPEWTYEVEGTRESLSTMYQAIKDQYMRYLTHVLRNVGGVYETKKSDAQPGEVMSIPSATLQQQALDFFNAQVFNTPYWLLDTAVLHKVNAPISANPLAETPVVSNFVEDVQARMVNSLLDIQRMNRILDLMQLYGNKAYPLDKYLGTIHQAVWKELGQGGPVVIDRYRRNLQKNYLGAIMVILVNRDPGATETDASSIVRVEALNLQREITQALTHTTDMLTKAHLLDLQYRIKNATNPKD